ncbi:MAG: hypothetical protein IKU49_00915 [Prevotella sp.]|nr:hypothetical protein [Prevotella sp.]
MEIPSHIQGFRVTTIAAGAFANWTNLTSVSLPDGVTSIKGMNENSAITGPFDVYDLRGLKVRHQVNSLDGLPDGIYIVNGRKVLKK